MNWATWRAGARPRRSWSTGGSWAGSAGRTRPWGLSPGHERCGKTTFVKTLLAERGAGAYWNWDDIEFRRRWVK